MTSYDRKETIAAIATPPGEGGVAIIRISGTQALDIGDSLFSGDVKSYKSHTTHFGKILKRDGSVLDKGLLLPLLSPKSYTGEDTVEIHCHGGVLIAQSILQEALQAGAKAAFPGEFTFRAYRSGKIDLAQAEAVQQLIGAKNSLSLQMQQQQLEGSLSKKVCSFQNDLLELIAHLEVWVDFPEEEIELPENAKGFKERAETIKTNLSSLRDTFHEGQRLSHGIHLAILGPPNVGKSSLLNALIGKERAIVTEVAGTTRDTLEEEILLGNLHLRLLDTAGIRKTDEKIELEGIRRSHQAAAEADLLLLVLELRKTYTQEYLQEIQGILATLPEQKIQENKLLIVWNKTDLPHSPPPPSMISLPIKTPKKEAREKLPEGLEKTDPETIEQISLSAKAPNSITPLKEAITRKILTPHLPSSPFSSMEMGPKQIDKSELYITKERHFQAIEEAMSWVDTFIRGYTDNLSYEFLVADLRSALQALNQIIEIDITEEVLGAIFSQFCIGK